MNDLTIYALASGHGRAGIAVIRISGPNAVGAAKALSDKELPVRRAVRIDLKNPADEELLDQGLAIFFPGPASFTGEDVVELHVHGGIAVIDSVLSTLATIDGLRLAEPGEFTRRGFENGKIGALTECWIQGTRGDPIEMLAFVGAGEETGPPHPTGGGRDECILEADPLASQPVYVWGFDNRMSGAS